MTTSTAVPARPLSPTAHSGCFTAAEAARLAELDAERAHADRTAWGPALFRAALARSRQRRAIYAAAARRTR